MCSVRVKGWYVMINLLAPYPDPESHAYTQQRQSRPLFFIGHSIGGLVVKLALVKASKIEKYRGVMYNCHGVSFFCKSLPEKDVPFFDVLTAQPHHIADRVISR